MVDWTANVARIRTTGGSGLAVGVITGMGATPQEALAALRKAAEGPARDAVERVAKAAVAAERVRGHPAAQPTAMVVASSVSPEVSNVPQVSVTHAATTPPGVMSARGVAETRRYWQFEVVDVRLIPSQLQGGGPGWLAYGTLAWDLGGPSAASPGSGGTAAGPATGFGRAP